MDKISTIKIVRNRKEFNEIVKFCESYDKEKRIKQYPCAVKVINNDGQGYCGNWFSSDIICPPNHRSYDSQPERKEIFEIFLEGVLEAWKQSEEWDKDYSREEA